MAKINGISVSLDMNQGRDEQDRSFGYVCGDDGGFFFTWMPTLEATLASVEEDEQDGDGGLTKAGVVEFLRGKLAGKFADEVEISDEQPPEYKLRSTESGYSVVRIKDDSYAEFLDSDEADEAMKLLVSGDKSEDDYEWSDA